MKRKGTLTTFGGTMQNRSLGQVLPDKAVQREPAPIFDAMMSELGLSGQTPEHLIKMIDSGKVKIEERWPYADGQHLRTESASGADDTAEGRKQEAR